MDRIDGSTAGGAFPSARQPVEKAREDVREGAREEAVELGEIVASFPSPRVRAIEAEKERLVGSAEDLSPVSLRPPGVFPVEGVEPPVRATISRGAQELLRRLKAKGLLGVPRPRPQSAPPIQVEEAAASQEDPSRFALSLNALKSRGEGVLPEVFEEDCAGGPKDAGFPGAAVDSD